MSDSRFGLSSETLAAITHCLRGYPDIRWARIYGSRAKGNYERGSDIDIAFSSPIDCTADLREALDDLPTPYLFDVTHYESLQHEGLKAHIDCVGVVIYRATTPVRPEPVEGRQPTPNARPEPVEGRQPTSNVRPELVEGTNKTQGK